MNYDHGVAYTPQKIAYHGDKDVEELLHGARTYISSNTYKSNPARKPNLIDRLCAHLLGGLSQHYQAENIHRILFPGTPPIQSSRDGDRQSSAWPRLPVCCRRLSCYGRVPICTRSLHDKTVSVGPWSCCCSRKVRGKEPYSWIVRRGRFESQSLPAHYPQTHRIVRNISPFSR